MGTREIVEKLPQNIRNRIEEFRKRLTQYHDAWDKGFEGAYWHIQTQHAKIHAYTTALADAGVLTEQERRIVYNYGTILNRYGREQ